MSQSEEQGQSMDSWSDGEGEVDDFDRDSALGSSIGDVSNSVSTSRTLHRYDYVTSTNSFPRLALGGWLGIYSITVL